MPPTAHGKWLVYVIDDGAHQGFDWQHVDGVHHPHVIEKECVGCNLCYLICPSPARTMKHIDTGGTRAERVSGSKSGSAVGKPCCEEARVHPGAI